MKRLAIGMVLLCLTSAGTHAFATTHCVEVAGPAAQVVAYGGRYVSIDVDDGAYLADGVGALTGRGTDVGAPALPSRLVYVTVPAEARVTGVTHSVTWETLARDVVVAPVGEPTRERAEAVTPVPDAAIYGGTGVYPSDPVAATAEIQMGGLRTLPLVVTPFRWHPVTGLLERATKVVVTVAWDEVGLAMATARFATASQQPETVDYLLIAPPVFYEDWKWYVGERKKVHSNLTFAVKNTAEIYGEYPFGGTNDCRNAAESIHAYLRANWKTMGLKYVVLGGAWLDAQNLNGYTPYFATGEEMSLSNCVPGVYSFPRENWRQIPSDLFYGCFDMVTTTNQDGTVTRQKYPWDLNGDGKYLDQSDCSKNDTYPEVAVSRITLNPQSGYGTPYNQHELITNYVAKLARGEARYFAGHYRYGMSVASTGSSKLRKTGDRMCYRELEFYDGMYNMFDPRHHDSLEDGEYSTRDRYYSQFSLWRPIRSVTGMMSYTWTGGLPTLAAAMDHYYASDRDFGYVQAHGWAQGAAQFSAGRFATASGLTLFNGGSGPCETGYPDYHVQSGSRKVLQYNVGDAAVTNPKGGALASVNNSRWSWAGGGDGFAAMSYYMLNEMLIGFNGDRLDVGNAWLKGVRNYWPAGRWGSTAGWVLVEQFLYGDPLVRLPALPNYTWQGGETGVWDLTTGNWTNDVDAAAVFDAASNVYFTVGKSLDLDVAGEIAAQRLSLPAFEEDAVITLAGTGTLRVMQSVDVAGTNATLAFNVAGGVGHDGIRFVRGAGDLVFEGTNKFYVAGVTNVRRVALRGGGVTLDVDEFAQGSWPIVFGDGTSGTERPVVPNELRGKNAGGLRRFGSLGMTNTFVKLSTVDAFGNGEPMTHALADSELEIAANVYYQRSGFPEGLNATFLTDGSSAVTSSAGGVWTVKHTTTFALGASTHLSLSAETVDAGGEIVITNRFDSPASTNVVEIAHAAALAGDVTIGKGIRLVLRELPLAGVTSLTVGEGSVIELPDDASGYWQIVPVSSKFACGTGVTFATSSAPEAVLDGSPSPTGSFFEEGALYRWTGNEGAWDRFFANRHPKILFGDIASDRETSVTVRVATAVSPEFVFYSNLRTGYVYESADEGASVLFASVYFCGPTTFAVPVYATEYVDISTATTRFSHVAAPYVHVSAGAGLALAGSHWTEFRLDEGAVLVAVPEGARDTAVAMLDWNAETTMTFPDSGSVLIDVGGVTLGDEPTPLIGGAGHTWTLADLKRFELVQTNVELRVVDGRLCAARGEGMTGPYALTFAGATNWNCAAWTWASNAFGKAWGDCALDWTADAVVTATNAAQNVLTLDCDAHVQTLTIQAGTNDFTLAKDGSANLSLVTLDLSACEGTLDIGVETGNASILLPSTTNGTGVVRLRKAGSGMITLSGGSTLILEMPGDWTLNKGAQGSLRVVAPQAYERFRIAKVASGFENSGLTIEVTDAQGAVISGFKTSVSDGALWCEPPALQAEVPPGTNDLTRLVWRDMLGNVVSNVDWEAAAGFRLIGSATSGVVIAKSGFSSVWSRLSVSNDVTIYGNETLSPAQIPGGDGTLALAGAFTIKADVNASPNLLSGAKLKLLEGTTLEIRHRQTSYNASGQDWSGISGTGRILFADAANTWLALPGKIFGQDLTVETSSDIVLTESYAGHAFGVRNLSGSGLFRSDWGNGNVARPVRTVQTAVSAYSGSLHVKDQRDSKLVVASDDATASTNKALIVCGTASEAHTLEIETSGCVILTGTWKGEIKVDGILVITNACATNGVTVSVSAGGEVRCVTPDDVPAVTPAADYVAPTYPADPEPADVESADGDERPRIVTAMVCASDAAWTQLDWRDTNGVALAQIDWAHVTNATLLATNGNCRIVCDAEDFAGVVKLAEDPTRGGAITVEARRTLPFTLDECSVGVVEFRLSPVPTSTCDILQMTACSTVTAQTSVVVHDRYGRVSDVAGEVAFDATARKYYFNVQNVNGPTYSCTFDAGYEDTITSPLWFSGSGNLTYKARPEFFVESRAGRALLGTSMNHFSMHSHNGNPTVGMDNVNAWSFNFVVKLPTNDGGIIFGWGNKDSGNGVAFARVSENVAGVYAWENGGGVRLVASANVPFGSTQFHSYALTHDSHTLNFYVDGVLAQSASLEGKYPSRGFYQWFKMYGQNGRLQNGPTTVIDDFRLYVGTCLTASSVRLIAEDFPPWPEVPSASVDCAGIGWDDLYWTSDSAASAAPVEITGDGGTLALDAPVVVTNALTVTGGAVPVTVAGDGMLAAPNGVTVTATSGLRFDASALDGTNLASRAVAGVPYARWLLRGAYTGPVTVTALPAVPEGYAVRVEEYARYGVRLVFTAPRYAFGDSVGLSVGDEAFSNLTSDVGLHPTSPTNWFPYAVWTNEATEVGGGIAAIGGEGGKVDAQRPYGSDSTVPRYFWQTSFDGDSDDYNGKTNAILLAGLASRFNQYRVLVYLATDTVGAHFGPVTIAGRTYGGVSAGDETSYATVTDFEGLSWGKSRFAEASEGVNVVVSDVLTNDTVQIGAQRLKNGNVYARAQIAAVQIVAVGEIHEFTGTRYAAAVTDDTAWDDGKGSGLAYNVPWRNDPYSTITLTAGVEQATLVFDGAVTAETLRVVAGAGASLALRRSEDVPLSFVSLDLSDVTGTVTFADGIALCGTEAAPAALTAGPDGGTIAFIVDNVATNQRLMRLATEFDYSAANFSATVRDANGASPLESWSVLPLGGWLVLQLRDVEKPWYALTFEGALATTYGEAKVVPLKSEGSPTYVASRGGQAMTGGTPYSSDSMASVPDAWTVHAVAEMPEESQGILFGYGAKSERGIGLVTVDSDTVALAWWDQRGRFTLFNADVPHATCQYHAYAIVSTGAGVALYVDGAFKGRASVPVNPASARLQIGSICGGVVSGFVKTTTGALDDWRLYDGVLSTNAIAALAAQFAPWPEYRTAELIEVDSAWDELAFSPASGDGQPLLVDVKGGSLAVTNICTVTDKLVVSRAALPLRMSQEGRLVSHAGLTFLNGWNIDCSALEGSNLTSRAAAGVPYVHTLVEGAYSGGDPTVTGLPVLSDRYTLTVVTDATRGVWLVITVRADYVACLTNATTWADGKGAGLEVLSDSWANDPTSTITLTQSVDTATLTLDGALTSSWFKVVSTNAQWLTLAATSPQAIARYDFSDACGTLVISNDCFEGATLDFGLGTTFTIADGVLDLATARLMNAVTLAGGKIMLRLTEAEEKAYGALALVPVPADAETGDYVVLSADGIALEPDWVTIEEGMLTVDTSGMEFPDYVMPLRGVMAPGKAWAEQTWVDSSAEPRHVPAVYWGSAANVSAVVDIASNAEVTVAAGVTNVAVRGFGTIVSDGKWPNFGGLTDEATWHGTLRIANKTGCKGENLTGLGNATSTVEMDGVAGWFNGCGNTNGYLGTVHPYALKVGEKGFTMNDGSSGYTYTFARLVGDGTFTVGKENGPTMRLVARASADFTGRICVIGNAGVTLGTPAKFPDAGTIAVAADATANVTADAYWSTVNGLVMASGATLNIVTDSRARTNYTVTRGALTLPENAHLTVNGGDDERDFWYVVGGDVVRVQEWTGTIDLAESVSCTAVVVTNATTLAVTGDACVTVDAWLRATSPLTIDARGLDGTNIAMCAVVGAPYSRWLVRGPVTGDVAVMLPSVPSAYAVASEILPDYGVRLVVTANRLARFGAISVNLCHNAGITGSDETSGLYPVARCEWENLTVANNAEIVVSNVTFTLGSDATGYHLDKTAPDAIYQQYMDDKAGSTRTLTVSGIEYPQYRLIVYYATDTANVTFQPLIVNDVCYTAQQPGANATQAVTIKGVSTAWGDTGPDHQALEPAEGVNALVTDVLTGSTATIKATKPNNTTARATIAAVQVVKVGVLNEEYIANYAAELAGDVAWQNGAGAGLVHEAVWVNHPYATISLTPVAPASLVFDSSVTASVLRVTSDVAHSLVLSSTTASDAIDALDFSSARGAVAISNTFGATSISLGADTRIMGERGALTFAVAKDQRLVLGESVGWQTADSVAAGGCVRFLGAVTTPQVTTSGAIVSYAKATFTAMPSAFNWVLRLEDSADRVTFDTSAACYLPIDIVGGELSLGASGSGEMVYGGIKNNTATNSILVVNGGVFTTPVAGSTTANGKRGFIVGATGDASVAPRVIVNAGLFSCENGLFSPWEKATVVQNGGILRAKGIWKGGYTTSSLILNGGVTEIGSFGIAKHTNANGTFAITLAGGTVKAVAGATMSVAATLATPSTLCAVAPAALTVSGKLTANAGASLTIGATDATGEVIVKEGTLGDVTVADGATFTVPFGVVKGNLTLGENATLNLAHTGAYTTTTNQICTGVLTLGTNARILLNGNADLPAYLTREDNAILFAPARQSWLNPVTGAMQTFTYRFTGAASADWNVAGNWQKYVDYVWQTSSVAPMVESSNAWDPTVIDGENIAAPAHLHVSLTANMEGWTPQLALFNGVTATVNRIKKLQSTGSAKWFWVDATSQLLLNAFGDQSYDGTLDLYVANSNGIVFASDPVKDDTTFRYYFSGFGSVRYTANLTRCAHQICRADIQLSRRGFGKVVRSKLLVGFPTASSAKFTWSSPQLFASDPEGEITAGNLVSVDGELSASYPVASCILTQRLDGVYLDYVDRDAVDHIAHAFDTPEGETSHVNIPYDWVMRLANGPSPLLSCDAEGGVTAHDVTAALNSTAAPNGILPWQSYMLGLDPTNALDDVHCEISTAADGKFSLRLPNVDPAKQPSPTAVTYALEHKTSLTNAWQVLVSTTNTHELTITPPTATSSGFYRYRIMMR